MRCGKFLLFLGAAGLALGAGGCVPAPHEYQPPPNHRVLDAGHGGKDSGAVRRYSPAEKTLALDVALRVNRKLHESQMRTVLTRSNDTFIPLDERVAMGNAEKNSIFVSIHFNDSGRRGIRGFETYYHSPYAADLAQTIERKLSTLAKGENRGTHIARFRVLRNAEYPSVLVECGYLSNRSEGNLVSSPAYREEVADKRGIVDCASGGRRCTRCRIAVIAARSSGDMFAPSFR